MPQFNIQLKAMVLVEAIDHEDALAKAKSILDTTKAQKIFQHSIDIAEIS